MTDTSNSLMQALGCLTADMSKLIYEPLAAARNEIRLLRPLYYDVEEYESTRAEQADSPTLRFSLEHVSLNEFTDLSKTYMEANHTDWVSSKDYSRWLKTCCIQAGLPAVKNNLQELDNTELQPIFHRWVWGDFIAISYVWGESTQGRQIEVNEVMHPVTNNLFQVLHELWHNRHQRTAMLKLGNRIWVDAICINQEDIEERNRQVQRIATIYKQANQTFAWLDCGIEHSDISRGLAILASFASVLKEENEWRHRAKPDILAILEGLGSDNFIPLCDVLLSPYWSRLWIVQEITISTSLTFLSRGRAMPFSDLEVVLWLLRDLEHEVTHMFVSACQDRGLNREPGNLIGSLIIIRQLLFLRGLSFASPRQKVSILMNLTRSANQKDERDKVYGLLSLFDDGIRNAINPDYRLPVSDVYTDFARASVSYCRSLNFICNNRSANDYNSGLPSWVTDWRNTQRPMIHLGFLDLCSASGTSQIEVEFSAECVLSARGFIFDRCDGLGVDMCDVKGGPNESIAVNWSTVNHSNAYGSHEKTKDALCKTLLADRHTSAIAPSDFRALFMVPWDLDGSSLPTVRSDMHFVTYYHLREWNSQLRLGDRFLKEYYCSASESQDSLIEDTIRQTMRLAFLVAGRRRLLVTAKGYLGLAASLAQPGDAICILLGCSMPVILRPREGTTRWTVIGECYVHGIMDGEAMKLAEDHPSIMKTFDIC